MANSTTRVENLLFITISQHMKARTKYYGHERIEPCMTLLKKSTSPRKSTKPKKLSSIKS
ncbi:hypothetical protein BGLA2_430027 [Burkholderia gladioli]|nr:hypothetical protein BGLA2_430027 [Burkholderia gladioli]